MNMRPLEMKESEWDGTGRPPVGTECEAVWLEAPDGGDRDFERVIIKGYWENQVWFCTSHGEDFTHLLANVDFRPIRTDAQPEWTGTGPPEVGTECEVLDRVSGKLNRVEITAVSKDHFVALFNGSETLLKKNCQFRPIRTKAQREREDLINAATEILNQDHVLTERNAAEALYEAGMLRGAGE